MKIWQKYALWYSALTLVYLFPLILNFRGLAGHGDAWQFVWNLWWIKQVLTSSAELFYTNVLHWPDGISLIVQTFTFASSIPAVAISTIVGLVPAYNIMVILHFIFSGMAMYFLCLHISKNHFASFVAGFLFAFSPFRFTHYYGHLHLMTTELIPLTFLFLLRTLEGKKYSWIGAVLFFSLTAYADWYYFLFLCIASIVMVIWHLPRERVVVGKLFCIVAGIALLTLPYLGTAIHEIRSNPDFQVYGHDALANANSWSDILLPGGRSMFQSVTARWWRENPGWPENGSYIGWSVLFAVFWGLWKIRTKTFYFWIILGSIFLALTFEGPYLWLESVFPILEIAGVPLRFFAITSASLAVLVSIVLAKQRKFVVTLFLIFIAFEYLPAPVEVSEVSASPFYEILRKDPRQFAILDMSDAPARVLYFQTIHEKPLVGGYTTRPTVSANRFLEVTDFTDKKVLENLRVRYVLVSPWGYYDAKDLQKVYSDEFLTAYRVF